MFSRDEITRYSRQLLIDEWGDKSQQILKNTTVFVAGAGGSGSPILTQLALLGVGHIRVCDFDTVDLSNLNRQFIHTVTKESKLGINKAVSAKQTIHNINPHIKVEVFEEKINDKNIDDLVGESTMLFDSVDKIDVKFILSKCAMRKKIPHLFYGMMDINGFAGVFYPPKTACFHCLFDFKKVQEISNITKDNKASRTATPVCCPPVFMTAGFIMTEALKILLGIGEVAYNEFFLFLQKGSEKGAETTGYRGMRYWMSRYFYDISLTQGFDLDKCWRGNMLETLKISSDPDCKYCSSVHKNIYNINEMDADFDF